MNLSKLLKSIVKTATPVAKAAAPIVITAIVLHQPIKTVLKDALRDELGKDQAGA